MRWWSEREILHGAGWRHRFSYQDRRGTARVTHRPDLAVLIAGRPVPVEVELQRKPRARLLGSCACTTSSAQARSRPTAA